MRPVQELVAERLMTGTGDSLVVALVRGRVYRMHYEGASGTPAVLLADRRRTRAFLNPRASGLYELYPVESDRHIVRVVALSPGDTARVRIFADPSTTDAVRGRRTERRARSLAVGVSVSGGVHDAYPVEQIAFAAPGGTVAGGTEYEAGLWAGAPRSWFSAVLGVSMHPASLSDNSVTWFFLEPRARVHQSGRADLGGSMRFAMGSVRSGEVNPSLVALGAYATYRLTADESHRGPRAQLGYSLGIVGNTPAQSTAMHRALRPEPRH